MTILSTSPDYTQASPHETAESAAASKEFREFDSLINQPDSLTAQAARRFEVTPEKFANWRWQMSKQVSNREEAAKVLALSDEEQRGFESLSHLFNAGITPYYLSLMNLDSTQSCPVRLQALPRHEELNTVHGQADPLGEVQHSPVKEVVQAYPDRVAFCVAQLCPVYCRYCFRKRRDEEDGLHFNRSIIERGIKYISKTPAIRDVLITGGDPFIAQDSAIENLLIKLRAIPHVEIIRFGTRTPVTLPYRVTKQLARMIAKYHPVWVNTHFNCVEELTPEARQAVANLVDHGIPVGNQSVLLKGVNDTTEKQLALLRALLKARVRPYYIFHPHLIAGTEHLRVSVDVGLKLMKSLRGNITGFGIPQYIIDTPGGKVPLQHNHMLGRDGRDLLLEDPRGDIWREKEAFI